MRIVKRVEFAKLPENTLYSEYEPCVFGPLTIKCESINDNRDWFEQTIADSVDAKNSEHMSQLLYASEKTGESVKMDFDVLSRNGLFEDDDRLYAVWEPRDVSALIERLKACL